MESYGGKDATEVFFALHRTEVLSKYAPKLLVGSIKGEKSLVKLEEDGKELSTVPYAEASFW